ncbi:3-hydroxyacyl-CoA dehydrogenase NAD-binding domain-containing protein [Solirubrum puertoriconensis]|uniref:3-hydroxybutyryl-CoA dehydrogenase n=1 Tax=Solirubrum puertoriconensis TaxID=1751427 RepID=A0A9X0HL57_SOLP1|nr:3-hydroxyacyl-CoA dehydrogenase NAD-binding domain-containing protein [Solirubrum puertoriconensis]KUG07978.1 3-hydroxybutyryl-CoA dehydrogenase [Solirubrum puertoriconensis]
MTSPAALQTIAVVGAGTMGAGIAQLCLQAGYRTLLYDVSQNMLLRGQQGIDAGLGKLVEKGRMSATDRDAALERLAITHDLEKVQADIVIEAVVEKMSVKHQLFIDLAAINSTATILASNTSTFPITQLAAPVPHPERVVGMHFFNPAPLMPLVEIISGVTTAPEVSERVRQLAVALGKKPVLAADAPGFIVNRVARHYYVESLKALEENVAPLETIDELLESAGFRMGPFKLMDLIGVDTNFAVTSSLYEAFHYDPKFRPNRIQQQKVDAGHHGRKSGRGFYQY